MNLQVCANFYVFNDSVKEAFTTAVEYNQQRMIRISEGIPMSAFNNHIGYRANIYRKVNGYVRGPFVSK